MCEIFPFCDPLCSMALKHGDNSFTSTVLVPCTHLDNCSLRYLVLRWQRILETSSSVMVIKS